MKTTHSVSRKTAVSAASAALAIATSVFCGCESADTYEISVKPRDATVTSAAPSVALTASGWRDFQWALSDTSLGYLSASKGDSVVYTARSGTFSGGRQTITVTAVGSGGTSGTSSSSSTNAPAGGYTAQVIVTHKDETTETTDGASGSGTDGSGSSGGSGESGGSGGSGGTGGDDSGNTTKTLSLTVTTSPSPPTVTSATNNVWLTASIANPPGKVSYSWKTNKGEVSMKSGPVTMYSPPKNPKKGQVATVTCIAECSGYKRAEVKTSVPFDIK